MKISFLSLFILLGCLFFNPTSVMALHHEPQKESDQQQEKMGNNE